MQKLQTPAPWIVGLVVAGLTLPATGGAPHTPGLQGDAARGAQVYAANCGSCHSLDANRVGPAHRGVFGRKAGTAPGFAYSPALHSARFVWDQRMLDRWLQNPQALVPGTRMGFRLGDPQRRADVIAYLRQQSVAAGH
ncbi:MAG: c-type cytochrome [Sphingomonadales bacterium]|nr:c-type cytochrome [Sphingomonadales bacterium]